MAITGDIDVDAGAIIVADSRGQDTEEDRFLFFATYGFGGQASDPSAIEALHRAKDRQHIVALGLPGVFAQWAVLGPRLTDVRTKASALRTALLTIDTAAQTDLDNPDAGDSYITALATLDTALATVLSAMSSINALSYELYRDGP